MNAPPGSVATVLQSSVSRRCRRARQSPVTRPRLPNSRILRGSRGCSRSWPRVGLAGSHAHYALVARKVLQLFCSSWSPVPGVDQACLAPTSTNWRATLTSRSNQPRAVSARILTATQVRGQPEPSDQSQDELRHTRHSSSTYIIIYLYAYLRSALSLRLEDLGLDWQLPVLRVGAITAESSSGAACRDSIPSRSVPRCWMHRTAGASASAPPDGEPAIQRYLQNTNILETSFRDVEWAPFGSSILRRDSCSSAALSGRRC